MDYISDLPSTELVTYADISIVNEKIFDYPLCITKVKRFIIQSHVNLGVTIFKTETFYYKNIGVKNIKAS